jgi:hypothetical protein
MTRMTETAEETRERDMATAKNMTTIALVDNLNHELAVIKQCIQLFGGLEIDELPDMPVALLVDMEIRMDEIRIMVDELGDRTLQAAKAN